ncbi:DNA degradation protein EddB, partial [Pseudomonas aeruginosa]|nr:DNA degradation protein EddB [Pseudomonas aeruginosa]
GQGNCNLTRARAAQALVDWLAGDPTGAKEPDRLIIGDLNSYAKEDPVNVIRGAGYTDLVARQAGAGKGYSYVFSGQSGYLDHALANASLARQVRGAVEWHINADEP